ncbi:MAG: hypothetical protein N2691_00215 [Patescibacteria group bacterium]|nr:hypothetical protein [Patescibacteria group bacterium]
MNLSDIEIIYFFFKAFSVVFSLLFLVYAVIMVRQTAVLRDTLSTSNDGLFAFLSNVQLIVAVILILYSLILL